MSKELPPVKVTPEDYEDLEREITELFKRELYLPLLRILRRPQTSLQNSTDDLLQAILSGKIEFHHGKFTGRFNATLSRELKRLGATWDRKDSAWKIHASKLPIEVTNAIVVSEGRFRNVMDKVFEKLRQNLPAKIAEKLRVEHILDAQIWKTDQSVKATLKGITVPPKLTPERSQAIADDYTNNLKLDIKTWADEEVIKLRKRMQEHVFQGYRYEAMVDEIQRSYGVSQSKAKFLARQETNLLMTKYKEARYLEAGVAEYRWQCVNGSPNHPVRPMHKALEGKVFRWDTPPIVDRKGNRKNPGQDYNCRCVARPILKGYK